MRKKNYLIISIIILFFTVPYIYFYHFNFNYKGIVSIGYLTFKLFYIGSFLILIELFRIRLLKIITVLLLFIPYFTDLISVYIYNDYIGTSATLSMLNTTTDEFIEFSKGLWLLGGVIVIAYIVVSYLYLSLRPSVLTKKYRLRWFLFFSLLFVFAISGNIWLAIKKNTTNNSVSANFKKEIIKQYPVNFYYRVYELRLIQHNIAKYKKEIEEYSFYAKDADTLKHKVYVLIIGESQRYDIYINELDKKLKNNNLSGKNTKILNNFYSTGNFTAICVPMMLTRANVDSCDRCYREPSIVEVFKEAGYKTYWISNQDLFAGPPVCLFRDNVDEFYSLYNKFEKHRNDGIILPTLKKVLDDNTDKKFIVINLLGNHKYNYPDVYNKYKPNKETENISLVSSENKELFINSYKNQTSFELYVLDQIISEVDRDNSIASVVFASDHGESLFDAPHYYFGHGSIDVPVEQTHVFSFFWMSDRYIELFQNKAKELQKNSEKLTNTDCIFYSMADIANISFPKLVKSHSLVRKEYRPASMVRVMGGDMKIHKVSLSNTLK